MVTKSSIFTTGSLINTIELVAPPISQEAEPEKKCGFNAPAIRKEFLSKFDKNNILAL